MELTDTDSLFENTKQHLESHFDYILFVCKKTVNCTYKAEDLRNDVCFKIYNRKSIWNPDKGTFKTWISRIITNAHLDNIRADRMTMVEIGTLEHNSDRLTDTNLDVFIDHDTIIEVMENCLNDKLLSIMRMRVKGHKYRIIADELGITEGTVKSSISRAREILSKYLH